MKINISLQKQKLNCRYLLPLVFLGYALLHIYYPEKTIQALLKSLSTMLHLLPISSLSSC